MTRFNKQNSHAQCDRCNGKNEGEQAKHCFAIDKMYGDDTAKKLILLSEIRGQKEFGELVLKEIAKKYRLKFKKLSKEKGVMI